MAKKERKEKKEKSLEKMTAKELREIALPMPELTGVHGMNKVELIAGIKAVRGIVDEKKTTASDDVRELKKKLAVLKSEKTAAHESGGDRKQLDIIRKKINRLKKKTRRIAVS